jgi:subtilisin family serine protease
MKLRFAIGAVFTLLAVTSLHSAIFAHRHDARRSGTKRFIVLLKDNAVGSSAVEPEVNAYGQYLSNVYGGNVRQVFSHAAHGYVSELTDAQAADLANDPSVLSVEEDRLMTLSATESSAPWHLDRVDQRALPLDAVYSYSQTASNVNIYIIDTGIRYTHVDFGGRADAVYDNVNDGWNGNDCNGHGTHVAGLAASSTYGVAKGAHVHAVRVVGCTGATLMSSVLDGIDWVTAHHVGPSVANISLQIAGASFSLETALANSTAAGVTYTVAAGNSNVDACNFTPARAPSAITVGATDSTDSRAPYSNIGPCVDVFAPGTGLTSLSNANDTDTRGMSGTSMASPVVAGVAALYLSSHPSASVAEVTNAIKSTASSGILANVDATTPNLLVYAPLVQTARVRIRKVAQSTSGAGASSVFNYSAINLDSPAFSLTDSAIYQDTNVPVPSGATTITVTEAQATGWVLSGIGCVDNATGLPASNSTGNPSTRTAMIQAQPGADITCTFTSQPLGTTAAAASISGRVLSASGSALRGIRVSLVSMRTGRSYSAMSNSFGYYIFSDLPVGDSYTASVSSSGRYRFSDAVRVLTLYEAVSNLNFTSDNR